MIGWLTRRLAMFRYPVLLVIAVVLFLFDLVIPDAIPMVDEVVLGLVAALLASRRRERDDDEAPAEEVAEPAPPPEVR